MRRFIALTSLIIISTPVHAESLPSQMTEAQLASYISGRLNAALQNDQAKATPVCDESGCSVVVQ